MAFEEIVLILFAIAGVVVLYVVVRAAVRSGTRQALREHAADRSAHDPSAGADRH